MRITAHEYNLAKARLSEVYDGRRDNGVGICSNVRGHITWRLSDWLMKGWHYHTGKLVVVVPGRYDSHWAAGTLWAGQQKHLRMSLLRHMLKRLEQAEIV